MGSIKQFGLSSTAVEEWLPWGGIVRPAIMKQKDGSMFAIFKYEPYSYPADPIALAKIKTWTFRRGWVFWQEEQHIEKETNYYLIICWNPFISGGKAQNALKPQIKASVVLDYFESFLQEFLKEFQKYTQVSLLTYQQIMDVLSFSLSHGDNYQEMPDVPLYMDALLSQDIDLNFGSNDIYINGKRLYIVSFQAPWDVTALSDHIKNMTYRHSRRLVFFGAKESRRNLKLYTNNWFPGRKVIRSMCLEGILSRYNGYYTESFQFLLHEADWEAFPRYFEQCLGALGVNYIVQHYRLKETFWGSIPGLFLADTRPPIVGFTCIADFIGANPIIKVKKEDLLGNAKRNLIPTPVNVAQYFRQEKENV